MASNVYSLISTPGVQNFNFDGGKYFSVLVPTGGASVSFYRDAQGTVLLGTAVAGTVLTFASYTGFFYQSTTASGFTLTSTTLKVYSQTAAGTTVTNVTAETYTSQFSIPANVLFSGAVLKIKYSVSVAGVTGSPTLQPILRFGAAGTSADTALITTTAETATTSTVAYGEFTLQVRAAPGSAAAIVGTGTFTNVGAVATPTTLNVATLASTNFATNALLYVSLGLVWSAASASNQAASQIFEIELF